MITITIGDKKLSFNNVYYVNGETGDDTNNGQSKETALKKFETAIGKCIDGDAIYLTGVTTVATAITATKEISVIGEGLTSILQGGANVEFIIEKKATFYRAIIRGFMRFVNSTSTSQFIFHNCVLQDFAGNSSFGNHSFSDNGNSLGYTFNSCSFVGTHSSKFYSFNTSTSPILKATKCTISNSAFSLTAFTGRAKYTNQSVDNKYSAVLDVDFKAEEGYGVWSGEFSWAISSRLNRILFQSNNKVYSLQSNNTIYETKMTSNVLPSPLKSSASAEPHTSYPSWKAFNGSNLTALDSWRSATNARDGWIQLDFGVVTKVNRLMLSSPNDTSIVPAMAKDFVVEGSNDASTFIPIKSLTGQTWSVNETKVYDFDHPVEYRYYRINISKTHRLSDGSETSGTLAIGEILYSYVAPNAIREIPKISADNFIQYGKREIDEFEKIIDTKQYILQDTISENEQGLWTIQLNRKPLSIKF